MHCCCQSGSRAQRTQAYAPAIASSAALRTLWILAVAMAVSACASPGGTMGVVAVGNLVRNNAPRLADNTITVGIQDHDAPAGASRLSSIPPVVLRLLPFNDNRAELDREGLVTAAFGVPMGQIRFDPGPATLLGQSLRAELKAAGHSVTDSAGTPQVTGSIVAFEAHTDTTALYWDVIGSLAVSLQAADARGTPAGVAIAYSARCSQRTYTGATASFIAGVMRKCIADFATGLRNDGRVADALRRLATPALVDAGTAAAQPTPGAALPQPASDSVYRHADQRWSVSYPAAWNLEASGRFTKISKGAAIIGIHRLADVAGQSLDAVADAAIRNWERNMREVNTVRRVSRQRVMLAGDLAAIAIVHHIGAGQIGQSQKIVVVAHDRAYLIDAETHLGAWPDHARDFDRIIGSFRAQP